jgi:hypothetical protein
MDYVWNRVKREVLGRPVNIGDLTSCFFHDTRLRGRCKSIKSTAYKIPKVTKMPNFPVYGIPME